MLKTLLPILLLWLATLYETEGCGRTPSNTGQVTEPTASVTSSPEVSAHRLNCTHNETWKIGCLNDGECFAYLIEDERLIQCSCPKGYSGKRCDYINFLDFQNTEGDRIAKAGIAASVVAAVLFVTVLTLIFVWHKHYKKRAGKEKKQQQNGANGNLLTEETKTPSTPQKNGILEEALPLKESPV